MIRWNLNENVKWQNSHFMLVWVQMKISLRKATEHCFWNNNGENKRDFKDKNKAIGFYFFQNVKVKFLSKKYRLLLRWWQQWWGCISDNKVDSTGGEVVEVVMIMIGVVVIVVIVAMTFVIMMVTMVWISNACGDGSYNNHESLDNSGFLN